MNTSVLIQAIVSMIVITTPFDPVKVLFFNHALEESGGGRVAAAGRTAFYVAAILGATALAGRQMLEVIGIDLNIFAFVGGLAIAAMGVEMLGGGGASRTQGEDQRQQGPAEGDAFMTPLAIPLIAGPGAITTLITISAGTPGTEGSMVALVAAGVVALVAFVSFAFLGQIMSRMSERTTGILLRLGGLLLAMIGTQMMLGGLKAFWLA